MTCGHSSAELLEVLETRVRLLDGVRTARVNASWRAALLLQADQERLAAFESWRLHLTQPIELSIQRIENHTIIRYGSVVRIVPFLMLRTSRHTQFIAQILWEGQHPKPHLEQSARAWNEARPGCVDDLARDIAEWVANDSNQETG
jgi:hypothetical protein